MVGALHLVAPSPGAVDLHVHSNTSDGELAHTAVVSLARRHGVRVMALTDHDDTAGTRDPVLHRFLDQLGPTAPQVVPGVEITCRIQPLINGGKDELHIIGLGIDPRHPALRKALIAQRLGIEARLRLLCERLSDAGYPVRCQELGRAAGLKFPNKGDVAELLVARGYVPNRQSALALVAAHLPADAELSRPHTMNAAAAIALIHAAGGVAVLAHPHRNVPTHDPEVLGRLFAELAEQGLDAAECYRFDLPVELQLTYRELIVAAGLLPSGGSDFHEPGRPGRLRHPGDAGAPVQLWAPLRARIVSRGGCLDVRDLAIPVHQRANAGERWRFGRRAAG